MTTQKTNTPDSGLIELSKFRESLADSSDAQNLGLDPSLLSEHVPVLRVDKPRRARLGAAGLATAASVLLGLSSAAYALHHEVTQHRFSTRIAAAKVVETHVEPALAGFVAPQRIDVPDLEEDVLERPVVETVSAATTSTSRPRARSTAIRRDVRAATPMNTSGSTDRSIEALLNAATAGQVTAREGATRAAASTLPLRPARAHVSSSFRGVTSAIQACGEGEGVVSARATVDGSSGRVRAVSLSGVSGEAERCMERALMGVRVDPFQQDRLEITFPYRL